jgi:hypothetical protein
MARKPRFDLRPESQASGNPRLSKIQIINSMEITLCMRTGLWTKGGNCDVRVLFFDVADLATISTDLEYGRPRPKPQTAWIGRGSPFAQDSNHRRHGDRALPESQITDSMETTLCLKPESQASWRRRSPETRTIGITKTAFA